MAASRALGAASATASTGPAGGAGASARRLAASASASAAGSSGGSSGSGQSNAQERWYFTREQLSKSPSRVCGLDADKELAYRQQAANLIQDMGQRLQVSQLCINTAIVYMHRFYAFHSFTQFHRNAMAAAALFLAAKVEEQPRKLEHVIKVAHMCLHRGDGQPTLDVQSKHYQEQAQDLVFNENVLLQTLGFDVAIDHPHTHVVRTCNLIKATKDLAQTSYFMASNSLHLTTMCLQYRPTVVACFCIHLASKWSNWEIPQSNEGKHWFYYVDRSVTGELLEHLTAEFLHIFDRCPARLKKKIKSISNAQGTNSPQQPCALHPNNSSASNASFSTKDKDKRNAPTEDSDKIEYDKRLLFGPSVPVNPSLVPNPNKMDYREYKERQQQQQDRRRPPAHPSGSMPRPPEAPPSGSQSRQSSSSSNPPPLSQSVQSSQHRWPPNQRSKDANQSMRPHPSQSSSSSSRPHHRSSSSNAPPQIPLQSHGPPPAATEQRPQSRSLLPNVQPQSQPPPHSSRGQPQLAPIAQQQTQPPPLQPLVVQQPIQQPPQRPPSLFSPPEPQRKPQAPRRPPVAIPPHKELPPPLSPFSSSPPSTSQTLPELEQILPNKKEEPLPIEQPQQIPPPLINSVETDPGLVSNLLKESLPHKADKKKKKDKHKHKDRDKREEKKKHKKDKDKRREAESNNSIAPPTIVPPQAPQPPQPANPLKITIPKEAYANVAPQSSPPTKFKIKIPKDRLRAEPPPLPMASMPPQSLKIKIPKELVEGSRKRPHDGSSEHGGPHKAPRMPQHPSQQHKTVNNTIVGNGQSGSYK